MSYRKGTAAFRVNTSRGKTLLYLRYRDMRSRAHGRGTKTPWIYPPGFPWTTFADFREWALNLEEPFTKANNSPDRKDPDAAYSRTNVRWTTKKDNCSRARGKGYYGAQQSDRAVRGEEPPLDDYVPF